MSRYTKQAPDDYSYAEYLVALPWANEDDIINRLGRIEDILYAEDGTEIITLGRLRELAAAEQKNGCDWCTPEPGETLELRCWRHGCTKRAAYTTAGSVEDVPVFCPMCGKKMEVNQDE